MRKTGYAACLMVMILLGGGVPNAQAATFSINVFSFFFDPNDASINFGDTVVWTNKASITHTVTDLNCERAGGQGPCAFDSVFTMTPGKTFTNVFNTVAGDFDYKCTIHGFTGRLHVIDPTKFADFVISSMTFQENGAPNNAFSKRIVLAVSNQGDKNAPGSQVKVEYFYQEEWHQISQFAVSALPAGGTRTFTVTWTYTGKIGDFNIRATSDSTELVPELDELNNSLTKVTSILTPPGVVPGTDLLNPL